MGTIPIALRTKYVNTKVIMFGSFESKSFTIEVVYYSHDVDSRHLGEYVTHGVRISPMASP